MAGLGQISNKTSSYNNYFGSNPPAVWANYIYLEKEERDKFATKNQEYLIEQVQYVNGDPVGTSNENSPSIIRMNYNHPVKELVWCYQNSAPNSNPNSMWNFSSSTSNVNLTIDTAKTSQMGPMQPHYTGSPVLYTPAGLSANLWVNQTGSGITVGSNLAVQANVLTGNVLWTESGVPLYGVSANNVYGVEVGPLHKLKLILNGTDRAYEQMGKWYNQYQPYQYHSGTPYPGIYVYSFALKPEELQPSGSCNFSRIDMAQVAVSLKTGVQSGLNQHMFAVNYNILRIASGMGGLAFAN